MTDSSPIPPRTMKVRLKIGAYAGEVRELRYDAALDMIALGNAERVNSDAVEAAGAVKDGLVGFVSRAFKKTS